MSPLPADYLADVLRVDLNEMGCSRVILLGSQADMAPDGLRMALARCGKQVLVPPEGARDWIAALASAPDGTLPHDETDRLRLLLEDGAEHGVEAIVATSEALARIVRSCELPIPTLVLQPRGSRVPVKQVVFDMGGVLFRWDPLAMATRVCASEDDARALAHAVFGSPEWALQDAGALDDQTVAWTAKTRLPRRLHAQVDELVYHWHDHRIAIDGMEELIGDLKSAGYGIYLLSNAGQSFELYQEQLPARSCFDGIVVSYREHVVKPDARIYRSLLERFSLAAKDCLFIDDTALNVLAARRVGLRALRFEESVDTLRAILL